MTIDPGWLFFWLFAFAASGYAIGWSHKGLVVERRACWLCGAPTTTPGSHYCRRHAEQLAAEEESQMSRHVHRHMVLATGKHIWHSHPHTCSGSQEDYSSLHHHPPTEHKALSDDDLVPEEPIVREKRWDG